MSQRDFSGRFIMRSDLWSPFLHLGSDINPMAAAEEMSFENWNPDPQTGTNETYIYFSATCSKNNRTVCWSRVVVYRIKYAVIRQKAVSNQHFLPSLPLTNRWGKASRKQTRADANKPGRTRNTKQHTHGKATYEYRGCEQINAELKWNFYSLEIFQISVPSKTHTRMSVSFLSARKNHMVLQTLRRIECRELWGPGKCDRNPGAPKQTPRVLICYFIGHGVFSLFWLSFCFSSPVETLPKRNYMERPPRSLGWQKQINSCL